MSTALKHIALHIIRNKRFFFAAGFLAAYTISGAQTLVSATGSSLQSNSLMLEYSIGEISITTLIKNNAVCTQGLLQPVLRPEVCDFVRLVPNAFTPNGDGRNDCFRVLYWPAVTRFELTVYNRWGQPVFHSTDIDACWSGMTNGRPGPQGTYVYLITADTPKCGLVQTKGTITLIR
jgi:gliding motility-associated-like protein